MEYRAKLDELVGVLMERETLDREAFERLMEGELSSTDLAPGSEAPEDSGGVEDSPGDGDAPRKDPPTAGLGDMLPVPGK